MLFTPDGTATAAQTTMKNRCREGRGGRGSGSLISAGGKTQSSGLMHLYIALQFVGLRAIDVDVSRDMTSQMRKAFRFKRKLID